MSKIIDTIIGSLEEKKAYKQNEARAKALPPEYATAYKEIQKYIFSSTGLLSMEPLVVLVDMLEDAAANDKRVLDVTGPDVAAFVDELVKGEESYQEHQRKKLNENIARKLGSDSR
jgi:DNA-binding ferritin-like protein (Dps family)